MTEPRTSLQFLRLPKSREEISAIQSQGKMRAIRQARKAPFYRNRLDHVDLDRLDEPDVWASIPILDKDALRTMEDNAFYADFCVPPAEDDGLAEFWRSGGSTGRPLFYPRSRRDIEAAMIGFARIFACAGADLAGRAHCSFPLGIHPAGQMTARAAQQLGMGVLFAGAGAATPSLMQLDLIGRLKPKTWMGMPSYGLHLANLADQNAIDLAGSSVDTVIASAEPLSQAKREKIERMWGAALRDAFGMTEAGMMGGEDGAADGFRIWTDLFHIEVVDPETRAPVGEGEKGALVVTPLSTNNMTPFLRWYSGDIVSLRTDAAGEEPFSIFPVLKHAHRTSGFFKVRGVNINHNEFEDFMFAMTSVNDFKCEAVTADGGDMLRIFVELKRNADPDETARRIGADVKRVFEITPEVTVLESGTLGAEFESSIKAPRIIDRRANAA